MVDSKVQYPTSTRMYVSKITCNYCMRQAESLTVADLHTLP